MGHGAGAEGGRPGARKSRGGPRRAGRRAREQQQQGPRFLPPRPGLLFPSRGRARLPEWEGGRLGGGRALGPRGGKRYLQRPGGGEPEAASPAPHRAQETEPGEAKCLREPGTDPRGRLWTGLAGPGSRRGPECHRPDSHQPFGVFIAVSTKGLSNPFLN